LSKKFIVQEIPQVGNLNKFAPNFHPGPENLPIFQMEWPKLKAREFTSSQGQFWKEMEAQVLKQAKEKALFMEKEAYEKGFAQGERDGFELGQKRFEAVMQQIQKLLTEISRQQEELYKKHERKMVQLVLSITRKILRQEIHLAEEVIAKTLPAAFQHVVERKKIVVHLNPKDYKYLLAHPNNLPFSLEDESLGGVKILADPAITRGGCYIETPLGDIDATLEGQLDQIVSLIWQKFERGGLLT